MTVGELQHVLDKLPLDRVVVLSPQDGYVEIENVDSGFWFSEESDVGDDDDEVLR